MSTSAPELQSDDQPVGELEPRSEGELFSAKNRRWLLASILRRGVPLADAEDMVQEVLLRVTKKHGDAPVARARGLLAAFSRRVRLEFHRAQTRHPHLPGAEAIAQVAAKWDEATRHENIDLLDRAFATLAEDKREIFCLRQEGFTVEEVVEIMRQSGGRGCSRRSVIRKSIEAEQILRRRVARLSGVTFGVLLTAWWRRAEAAAQTMCGVAGGAVTVPALAADAWTAGSVGSALPLWAAGAAAVAVVGVGMASVDPSAASAAASLPAQVAWNTPKLRTQRYRPPPLPMVVTTSPQRSKSVPATPPVDEAPPVQDGPADDEVGAVEVSPSESGLASLRALRTAQGWLQLDPRRALTELDRHAARYPASPWDEERDAARIEALILSCEMNAGMAALQSFREEHPGARWLSRKLAALHDRARCSE